MQNATLVTHCGAERVGREALALLPDPAPLGTRHRPIRHDVLVHAIRNEAESRGMAVTREEYAVQRDGALLFGVLDLAGAKAPALATVPGTGLALGLRSGNDQSFALALTGGATRVFVCDNLAFSGDVLALHRKHTSGLDLAGAMTEAFDRFLTHSARFALALERLRATPVSDVGARELIYESLVKRVIPLKLFPRVHSNYFDIDGEARPDCADRSLWGLHNSFSRAFKALPPARAWSANVALGRMFDLRTQE